MLFEAASAASSSGRFLRRCAPAGPCGRPCRWPSASCVFDYASGLASPAARNQSAPLSYRASSVRDQRTASATARPQRVQLAARLARTNRRMSVRNTRTPAFSHPSLTLPLPTRTPSHPISPPTPHLPPSPPTRGPALPRWSAATIAQARRRRLRTARPRPSRHRPAGAVRGRRRGGLPPFRAGS